MFDWITGFIEQSGYVGIAILMFLENVFPPIPSELIMPLGGFSAAQGDLNIWLVILAGTVGSVAGALLWYYVGSWLGQDRLKRWTARHGRWLAVEPHEIDKTVAWFHRHGPASVLFGRLVPGVRTLISVPAGIARMGLPKLIMFSTVGTVAWSGLLAYAGYLLQEHYDRVAGWVNPVSNVVVGLIVLWYLHRVVTFRDGTEGGQVSSSPGGAVSSRSPSLRSCNWSANMPRPMPPRNFLIPLPLSLPAFARRSSCQPHSQPGCSLSPLGPILRACLTNNQKSMPPEVYAELPHKPPRHCIHLR